MSHADTPTGRLAAELQPLPPGRVRRTLFSGMLLLLWVAWPVVCLGDLARVSVQALADAARFVWWEMRATWPGHLQDLYSRMAWRAFWSGGRTLPDDLAAEAKREREAYIARRRLPS